MNSLRRLGVVFSFAMMLAACATPMQPVHVPETFTPAPADTPLWHELEAKQTGDWFRVLNTGSEAVDWRLRAIDSASDSLDVQTFIWDLDSVGHAVRDHLLAAAARGVYVRVLVDDSFIFDADQELLAIDTHDNIEIKVFNPYRRRSDHAAMRLILNAGEFHRLDQRMHNKVMVIDNQVAVIGGRNIADEYFGLDQAANFRDMELVAGGPVVHKLANGFDDYWNDPWSFPIEMLVERRAGHGGEALELAGAGIGVPWHREETAQERRIAWLEITDKAHTGEARLLLDEPPPENLEEFEFAPVQVGEALIEAIDAAQEDVWLVSAYLIPTEELEQAIIRAEDRGVRVRMLTNSINSNNHLAAHSAYRKHIHKLVNAGVDMYELRADAKDRDRYIESPVDEKVLTLHAKILILDDDQVFIGSMNLDPRSMHINTEMGLLIESPSLNREMRQSLEPDFSLRNAWHLRLDEEGDITWVSDEEVLNHQPTDSIMRRIEDWFLTLLPIEDEM